VPIKNVAGNGAPDLVVYGFGEVEIMDDVGRTKINVELVNSLYGNGSCTFVFAEEDAVEPVLSAQEQEKFRTVVHDGFDRVFGDLEECMSGIQTSYGVHHIHRPSKPKVAQTLLRPEVGVMAFVVDVGARQSLFVITHTHHAARLLAEDVGDDSRQSFLVVFDVTSKMITFKTREGTQSICF